LDVLRFGAFEAACGDDGERGQPHCRGMEKWSKKRGHCSEEKVKKGDFTWVGPAEKGCTSNT